MKNAVLISFALLLGFAACQNAQPKTEAKPETPIAPAPTATAAMEAVFACPMHPEVTGKSGDKCPKCKMNLEEKKTPEAAQGSGVGDAKGVVAAYLSLKNALTNDDSNGAATAGKALQTALAAFGKSTMTADQQKTFTEIADDATEHAEHIGANGGKIEHQREHFSILSRDVNDYVKTFGGGQPLYQDFCPMYDKGKGAIWLSETKDIKNPYYGKKMLTCGKLKEEIK